LRLTSRKKWTNNGTSRVQPVEDTLDKIISISKEIGVTRIADITNMDILGIPNYSAILPGTEDYIWVYSGKGPTKKHAMASALMESVERYCSLPSSNKRNYIHGTLEELSNKYNILHPDEVIEAQRFGFTNNMEMDFLQGFDLLSKEEILVPAPLALFRYTPKLPAVNPFAFHHTNGLASGNVLEEAICHALCEVIERDAISLAELRASAIPFHFIKQIRNRLVSNGYKIPEIPSSMFIDDHGIFPDVDISEIDYWPIRNLINKFKKAKIPLTIKDITSDIGVASFIATSIEWITHDYGYLAEGHGTHPDSRIALMRAITEVSQTRAANIQGARDDLRKIKYDDSNTDDKRSWQFMNSSNKIKFSDVRSYFNEDILDDINFILQRVRNVNLKRAIIVNLTNPRINIPVVRAIVPGLETFKITKSVLGQRARKYFRL